MPALTVDPPKFCNITDADLVKPTNRYIPILDPGYNPNPSIFTVVPNMFNIDKPLLLLHPIIEYNTTDYTTFKSLWSQRDLSGLPAEISPCIVHLTRPELHNQPEFLAARSAYDTKHRCPDDQQVFIDHENSLVRETMIQHEMRTANICRYTAKRRVDQTQENDPRFAAAVRRRKMGQRAEAHMWLSLSLQRCGDCKARDKEREERRLVRAKDPWLARDMDQRYGVGTWIPGDGFGSGEFRSQEKMRREQLIENARGRGYRFEPARWERELCAQPFGADEWKGICRPLDE